MTKKTDITEGRYSLGRQAAGRVIADKGLDVAQVVQGRVDSGDVGTAYATEKGLGKVASTAATRSMPRVATAASLASKGAGLAGVANLTGRAAGKIALPVTAALAAKDAYDGYNAKPNASVSRKLKNAGSQVLSGLTFGASDYATGGIKEAKDKREYGYEGDMAMSQLKGILQHAKSLHDMLEPDTDLPEWVQSKITLAYDYLQTAADYMSTEMNEDLELQEGSGVKVHSYSDFKDGVQDWADNHTHNGKLDMHTRKVNAGNKTWHQTTASHKGVIVGTFNHSGKGKSEEGYGRHSHWSDDVHEEVVANNAGGGNVAGLGVGPQGEPPVNRKKKKTLPEFIRRR